MLLAQLLRRGHHWQHAASRIQAACPQRTLFNLPRLIGSSSLVPGDSELTPTVVDDGTTKWLEKGTLAQSLKHLVRNPGRQTYIRRSAYLTYEKCTDPLDLELFFRHFQLSDTFYSWFLVVELHVWMCAMRFMQEGFDGEYARNQLIHAMWTDVEMRMKLLKVSFKIKKKSQLTLYQHFLATMVSYDEAIVTDDRCLASALWRNFFTFECPDAPTMETLVHYVRHQLVVLEKLNKEELLLQDGKVLEWTPLQEIIDQTKPILSSHQEMLI